MMLGFLLARAGIDTIVLEKHADFFRDFRGDTIHPSTMEIMHELGLLEAFLQVPHQEVQKLVAQYNGVDVQVADFSRLRIARPVLGLMPQWDFLNFLFEQAKKYRSFHLYREATGFELIKNGGRVTGLKAQTRDGALLIDANMVVGTDGRSSDIRRLAGLTVIDTGAPIDVLWFRLSKKDSDPQQTFGKFDHGRMMVMIDRATYWQCAYVIMKGDLEKIRSQGLETLRKELADTSGFLHDRVAELADWNDLKLLSVTIDHLHKWYADGVLCIGDAAHAMSPIGGVGINLAIQDAVAAANILYPCLIKQRPVPVNTLALIQKRREFPARVIQRMQVIMQAGIVARKNDPKKAAAMPLFLKLLKRFPFLTRFPAKFIGMGVRREHIQTPDAGRMNN